MSGSVPPGMMWNPAWVGQGPNGGVADPGAIYAVYKVPNEPMFIPDPNWGATGGPSDLTLLPLPSPALDFSDDQGGAAPDGMSPSVTSPDTSDDDSPDDFSDEGDDDQGRQRGPGGRGGQQPQRGGQAPRPISGGNRLGGFGGQDAGGYGGVLGGGGNQADPTQTIDPLGPAKAGTGTGAGYGGLGGASGFWGASYGGADYEEPSMKWPGVMPTDSFLQPFQAYFKQLPTFY